MYKAINSRGVTVSASHNPIDPGNFVPRLWRAARPLRNPDAAWRRGEGRSVSRARYQAESRRIGRSSYWLASDAAQSFRKLTHVQLVFQRAQRNSEIFRGPRDVPDDRKHCTKVKPLRGSSQPDGPTIFRAADRYRPPANLQDPFARSLWLPSMLQKYVPVDDRPLPRLVSQ